MIDLADVGLGAVIGLLGTLAARALYVALSGRHDPTPSSLPIDPPASLVGLDLSSEGAREAGLPRAPVIPPAGSEAQNLTPDLAIPSKATEERLRLSERMVAHLFRYRGLGPDDVARPDVTQRGIAVALDADQRAVSKVLLRLIAAGVVSEDRRHVRGGSRRVKVYTLTRRGEALAVEVRSRLPVDRDSAPGPPNGPSSFPGPWRPS